MYTYFMRRVRLRQGSGATAFAHFLIIKPFALRSLTGMPRRSPREEDKGWWRRRESDYASALIRHNLQNFKNAKAAETCQYAVLKYATGARDSSIDRWEPTPLQARPLALL